MPKLPEQQKDREFELLNKSSWNRGTVVVPKPVAWRRKHLNFKLPKKLIASLLVFIFVLLGAYVVIRIAFPDLLKQKEPKQAETKPFEYPLNVNEVKFPSEFLKQKFLENFQKASVEKDANTRYKYLEEDFTFLLGFYNSTHSYDYRVQLQKYSDYMKKNYPKQAEANKTLYDFACVDKLCDQPKYPQAVAEVQKSLAESTTIRSDIRDSLIRNLDTAVLSKDKNSQGNAYVSVLTSLALEYKASKDEKVKAMYLKLNDYVVQNYPDFKVPESVRIES